MQELDPHPITDTERHGRVLGVVEQLGLLLSLKKTCSCLLQKLIPFPEHLVHCGRTCIAFFVCHHHRRVTPIDELEQRRSQCRVIRRVKAELSPWQPAKPLLWSIPSETTEVYNDYLVRRLRLTVDLGVEPRAHV